MSMDEPILSPEELVALSRENRPRPSALDLGASAGHEDAVAAYDLTSPDRPVRGHLPALDLLHVRLASHLALTLERALGTPVAVQAEDTQLTKLGNILSFLQPPACICLLDVEAIGETALLTIEPALVLALMTRFYGGDEVGDENTTTPEIRALSTVEQGFARFIAGRYCVSMAEAWQDIARLPATVKSVETSPRFAAITPPGDVMVSAGFVVTTGAISGHMQFVVPYAALRPFHRELQSSVRQGHSQRRLSWHEQLRNHLDEVPLAVMGELGRATVSMQRLAALSADDVLTLDTDKGSPVAVYVEGVRKFAGRLTVVGGNIAIRIESDTETGRVHTRRSGANHHTDHESLTDQEVAR